MRAVAVIVAIAACSNESTIDSDKAAATVRELLTKETLPPESIACPAAPATAASFACKVRLVEGFQFDVAVANKRPGFAITLPPGVIGRSTIDARIAETFGGGTVAEVKCPPMTRLIEAPITCSATIDGAPQSLEVTVTDRRNGVIEILRGDPQPRERPNTHLTK